MKVGFYSDSIKFDGDVLENELAGGSENAFSNMVKSWKKNNPNDSVIVYNNNSGKYKEYCGVVWKNLLDFQFDVRSFDLDVFISLRDTKVFKQKFIDTKFKCLWSQDIMNESRLIDLQKNKYAIENIDIIFSNSKFSYNDLKKGFPNSDIRILLNGYNKDFIHNIKKEDIAIWGSTPFRGTQYLLELWPKIYERCTNNNIYPKLKIYGGMDLYHQSNNQFSNIYNVLSKMINTEICGSIPQKKLFEEMNKARLLLYPCDYIETSCMIMIESMSCGVWPISTNIGALNELIINDKTGNIINGSPRDKEYKEKFIEYAVNGFINKNKPNTDHLGTWNDRAKEMRKIILEKLNGNL